MTSEELMQAPPNSFAFNRLVTRLNRFLGEAFVQSEVISARDMAIAALLAGTLSGCGGGNPSGPGPTPGPTPVTQTIKVLTSDGRTLGTTTYTGNANEPLTIRLADLAAKGIINLNTIDQNYAALRKDNTADNRVGAAVTNTTTGVLTYTPTTPETLILWGMNKTNGTEYTCAADTPGFITQGFRNSQRYASVQRLTATNNLTPDFNVVEGDTTNVQAGLQLLNQAWTVNGIQYAGLTWTADNPGEMQGGLGMYKPDPARYAGVHIGNQFIVRPDLPLSRHTTTTVEESIETHFFYDDLCGSNSSNALFNGDNFSTDLTSQGKDYVRFGALMKRP